jgi:catechol 2,3-dioxygenase-like lactoylglutathione lyase family enzyme
LLAELGIERTGSDEEWDEWGDFSVAEARDERPATHNLHLGFVAPTRAHVDSFWRVGTEAGHRDDGEPGPRSQYRYDYYGSFLLDPDGNSVEAVHHGGMRGSGIDHLWIRVADVAAAKRFYETVAPHTGLRLSSETHDRASFDGVSSSFSLVHDDRPRTENLHLAFPAADDETVRAFHEAATAAGHPDNGAPGERAEYAAGYYAAFVLDPDGNNVEVVNHNR